MPETSIVIKAQDRYSDVVKRMSSATKAFSKDVESAEKGLKTLSQNKVTLKMDLDKAKRELRDLEKQFKATGDAADLDKLNEAQKKYDSIARNLRAVTKAAGDTEKAIAKMDNRAGSSGSGGKIGDFGAAFAKMGGAKLLGDLAKDLGQTYVASAFGANAGTIFSSALGSAASGAAIGSMIAPGLGTAAGAAIGAGLGVLSGGLQVQKGRDDAFKTYVQDAVEGQLNEMASMQSSGSSIAAQRESDRISFGTLFGDRGIADDYLRRLVGMSNETPFLYSDLTAMSKTLATYGYGADSILPVLRTIGDAGAALGMGVSDMSTVATALGRMRSSGKTSLEYLNMLNDRGINAVGMLADARGVSQKEIYDMISKGQLNGSETVDVILQALDEKFAGSMKEQSGTFSGLTSTVEGLTQELEAAMGEGFNEARKAGLEAQRDWLGNSEQMQEAYGAIGAWKASLENEKERYIREAVDAAMSDDAYKEAEAEGDAARMGEIIMRAKIKGMSEFNASDGAQLMLESEKSLIESVRNDTAMNEDYWDAGYERGQEFTKGMAAAVAELGTDALSAARLLGGGEGGGHSHAAGIDYVPYDNYPALLHQGEAVLTAEENRSGRGTQPIRIEIGNLSVREEADVDRIAAQLLARMELAAERG